MRMVRPRNPKTARARPHALSPSPVPWFPVVLNFLVPRLPHLPCVIVFSPERAFPSLFERREARGHPGVAARGMTASRECMSSCGGLLTV